MDLLLRSVMQGGTLERKMIDVLFMLERGKKICAEKGLRLGQ